MPVKSCAIVLVDEWISRDCRSTFDRVSHLCSCHDADCNAGNAVQSSLEPLGCPGATPGNSSEGVVQRLC